MGQIQLFQICRFFQFQSGYSVFIGSCQLCLESIKILPVQSVIMGNPAIVRSSSINICDTEAGNCGKNDIDNKLVKHIRLQSFTVATSNWKSLAMKPESIFYLFVIVVTYIIPTVVHMG